MHSRAVKKIRLVYQSQHANTVQYHHHRPDQLWINTICMPLVRNFCLYIYVVKFCNLLGADIFMLFLWENKFGFVPSTLSIWYNKDMVYFLAEYCCPNLIILKDQACQRCCILPLSPGAAQSPRNTNGAGTKIAITLELNNISKQMRYLCFCLDMDFLLDAFGKACEQFSKFTSGT